MTAPRSRRIGTPPTGATCETCAAECGPMRGYVPMPAVARVSLVASDYDGLNMGVERDCVLDLCRDCERIAFFWEA